MTVSEMSRAPGRLSQGALALAVDHKTRMVCWMAYRHRSVQKCIDKVAVLPRHAGMHSCSTEGEGQKSLIGRVNAASI